MTIRTTDVAHMYKLARNNGCVNTTRVLYGLLVNGLGPNQRIIYRALPKYGTITANKLSSQTGITRRNIHHILVALEQMGLVDREEKPENNNHPHKWRIIHINGFDR